MPSSHVLVQALNSRSAREPPEPLVHVISTRDRVVILDFGSSTTRGQGGNDEFSDDSWMAKVENGWTEPRVRMILDNLRGHGALARVTLAISRRAVLGRLDQNIETCK